MRLIDAKERGFELRDLQEGENYLKTIAYVERDEESKTSSVKIKYSDEVTQDNLYDDLEFTEDELADFDLYPAVKYYDEYPWGVANEDIITSRESDENHSIVEERYGTITGDIICNIWKTTYGENKIITKNEYCMKENNDVLLHSIRNYDKDGKEEFTDIYVGDGCKHYDTEWRDNKSIKTGVYTSEGNSDRELLSYETYYNENNNPEMYLMKDRDDIVGIATVEYTDQEVLEHAREISTVQIENYHTINNQNTYHWDSEVIEIYK